MPHPTQTSLLASNVRYKCFRKHFHLVFVCVCQINGPLRNLQPHKTDIRRHRCLQSAERVIISFLLVWIFSCHFFQILNLRQTKRYGNISWQGWSEYTITGVYFAGSDDELIPLRQDTRSRSLQNWAHASVLSHSSRLIPPWCTQGARRKQPAKKAASG